ncbi:hypothetical protein BCON_0014g00680 [Botryotinia convoluta]|uniref:Uncharacterized protein n=1 Tax=Botryotinia convoluta TaxID=54673 RepID=A0A4Z1IUQ6_9HELO|nr:hypothetical protein BCON_0014g00680 [Botryotinia convoluta]
MAWTCNLPPTESVKKYLNLAMVIEDPQNAGSLENRRASLTGAVKEKMNMSKWRKLWKLFSQRYGMLRKKVRVLNDEGVFPFSVA